jgi:hypothetical protein
MRKTLNDRLRSNPYEIQKAVTNTIKSEEKFRSRIKKRVEQMILQPNTYFFTFTLNDNSLDLTEKYHIKKIKATLSQATLYMINNDYGDKNGRLHYHALVSFDHEYDTTFNDQYQLGFINVRKITELNSKALYEYIMKLSNHTTKKSVAKIWRSRNTRISKNK